MNICIGCSFFENVNELYRMRKSLPHDMPVIGIDGVYDYFTADHPFSLDKSREMLQSYPNSQVINHAGWQQDKRQQYLDAAKDYDWLLVLDSDEYIDPEFNDWTKLYRQLEYYSKKYPNEQLFYIRCFMSKRWERAYNKLQRGRYRRLARIIKDPSSLKYAFWCHYRLIGKEFTEEDVMKGKAKILQAKYTIDGVRLITDSVLRGQDMLQKRDRWAYDQRAAEYKKLFKFFSSNNHLVEQYQYL